MTEPSTYRGIPRRDATAGLELPPGFTAIRLRESKDAMAHAVSIAAEEGAGTLVFVSRFDLIEFAVVLEPEEPLVQSRRAIFAVMNAVADSISAYVSPEKPVTFDWPDTIRIDGGIVGGCLLQWPEGASETEVPEWLVAGAVLRSVVPISGGATNPYDMRNVIGTGLEIEGVELLHGNELIESFARHLMVYVDRWQEAGFAAVGKTYLDRLPAAPGQHFAITTGGDLVEHASRGTEPGQSRPLLAALARPAWRDPATGEPWL